MSDEPERPSLLRRLLGDVDRLGWWTLPAFLVVGLAGAVMAGTLAVVYYGQQVDDLEQETRSSREDLRDAVEEVEAAGQEALDAIAEEVEAVRDALNRQQPVEDVTELGLVVVRALVNSPPPQPGPTEAQDGAAPAGDDQPDGAPLAQGQTPSESPTPAPSPTASPTPPPVVPRLGVAFAVALDGDEAFLATSYDLVADENARAGVVEVVEITLPDGAVVSGVVHSWDETRGIALLRAPTGRLPIGGWRPRDEPLEIGDRLTLVGVTPERQPVQMDASVAFADVEAVVADIPLVDFLRGAPIVDRDGRIVAIYTPGYRPFGPGAGQRQAVAPVGLLCERMLRGCEDLETAASEEPTPDG